MLDLPADGAQVFRRGLSRIRHSLGQKQLHLLGVVKGAAEFQFIGAGQPQSLSNKVKTLLPDRQRCTSQDRCFDFVEQFVSQHRCHIDGSRNQTNALLLRSADLDPVNVIRIRLLHPRVQ